MRVSAKADYAARAAAELAMAVDAPITADRIAEAQDIPAKFLETILLELKHAGIVRSQRGPDGGYTLARDPGDISLADVIRAVDGPLANVRGDRPENVAYRGAASFADGRLDRRARRPAGDPGDHHPRRPARRAAPATRPGPGR